jgi:hypothetical protein
MSTVPSAPPAPGIFFIGPTSVRVIFSDGGNDGGSRIDYRQIGYGANQSIPTDIVSSDGETSITGLVPGRVYHFWARTHNANGYSVWSGRSTATTLRIPDAPTRPLLASVTATTVDVSFISNGNGGATIVGYQIGYGTDSSVPTTIVSASSPQVISHLSPGITYYFWARARNSVGWSHWSTSNNVRTVAGVYVKVGTSWKLAVPYVKVAGAWMLAEAWTRSAGKWNRTL